MTMSFSSFSFTQTDHVGTETRSVLSLQRPRPRMLKDFLQESANSCSSSGFYSFPRKLIDRGLDNMQNNARFKFDPCGRKNFSKAPRPTLLRCLTSKAKIASSKALAIGAVVAAIKNVSFPFVKAQTLLPRSFSRRLSKKSSKCERENQVNFTVKVKDIIRWTSFHDFADDKSPPLDFDTSPDHYAAAATTATTTTTTTNTTTTNSNSSSWCESDFTAEDLPLRSWMGYSDNDRGSEGEIGKNHFPCVGKDSTKATKRTATRTEDDKKGEASLECDEEEDKEEQRSPVSVLDYPYEDDDKEEELEERARRLLDHVKAAASFSGSCELGEHHLDQLLLDFFWEELSSSRESETDEKRLRNSEKVRKAEAWVRGKDGGCLEWGLLQNGKDACVREMDREGRWKGFRDGEKQGLGLEIENWILGSLVDELLIDTIQV